MGNWRRICFSHYLTRTLFQNLKLMRGKAIPLVRALPIPYLHDWRKMGVCLINFNKGEDDERVFKILQYSEMECNCVKKITKGLFRKYSRLWKHKCESPITIKNIIHLGRRPPKCWGHRLQPIEPIGKSGTVSIYQCFQTKWITPKIFVCLLSSPFSLLYLKYNWDFFFSKY